MRVVPVCAVVLLTAGVTPLVAQNPAESPVPARLSLDEALARAAATSHRLAELRARESAAAAVLDQRKTADLPTIALQAGYQRTNHVDEFKVLQPDRSFQTLYPDVPDNWRTRVDLQWPIYTGGRDRRARAGGRRGAAGQRQRRRQHAIRSAARDDACVLGAGHRDRGRTRGPRVGDAHRSAAAGRAGAVRRRVPAAERRPHRRDAGLAREVPADRCTESAELHACGAGAADRAPLDAEFEPDAALEPPAAAATEDATAAAARAAAPIGRHWRSEPTAASARIDAARGRFKPIARDRRRL